MELRTVSGHCPEHGRLPDDWHVCEECPPPPAAGPADNFEDWQLTELIAYVGQHPHVTHMAGYVDWVADYYDPAAESLRDLLQQTAGTHREETTP